MKDGAPRTYTRRDALSILGRAGAGLAVGLTATEALSGCSEPPPRRDLDQSLLRQNWVKSGSLGVENKKSPLEPNKNIELPKEYWMVDNFERPDDSTLLIAGNSKKRKKVQQDGKPPGFYEYYFGAFALFDERNPQKRIWENDKPDLATDKSITAQRFVQYGDTLYALALRGDNNVQIHAFDLSSGKERWEHAETHRDLVKASDYVLAASVEQDFAWIDDQHIIVRYHVDNHEKDKQNNTFDAGIITVRAKDGKVVDTMGLGKHNQALYSFYFDKVSAVKSDDTVYVNLGNYLCVVKDGKAIPVRSFEDEAITGLKIEGSDLLVETTKVKITDSGDSIVRKLTDEKQIYSLSPSR